MSVMIESTDELLTLLKKLDLKVTSVDELRQLLATINANYNPDVARQKTGRLIGVTVPGYMAAAAFGGTFFAAGTGGIGSLALIWGAAALVSTAAVISAAIMTSVRRGRTLPDHSPDRSASRGEPVVTHITQDLSV
jgi:hypothetical protein